MSIRFSVSLKAFSSAFSWVSDMVNPWDPLPLPPTAEPIWKQIALGIGLVVSEWESVEYELGILCSHFCGGTLYPFKEYGKGRIFRERTAVIARFAEKYFVRICDQQKEGEFDRLIKASIGFSDRRNEVVHGLILDAKNVTFFQNTPLVIDKLKAHQYVILPHLYAKGWDHELRKPPPYAYNFSQMRQLAERMEVLHQSIKTFKESLPE